jgi:hypothetical protein
MIEIYLLAIAISVRKRSRAKKNRPQEKTILFSGIRSHYYNGMNPAKKRGSNKLASYLVRPYFNLFCSDFYTLTSVANPIQSIAIHFISFHFILAFRAITISPSHCKLRLEMVMWFRDIVSELSVQVPDFF